MLICYEEQFNVDYQICDLPNAREDTLYATIFP